jgi:hypothetical protein
LFARLNSARNKVLSVRVLPVDLVTEGRSWPAIQDVEVTLLESESRYSSAVCSGPVIRVIQSALYYTTFTDVREYSKFSSIINCIPMHH